MLHLTFNVIFEWLLNLVCYWAGAIAIVIISAGKWRPGLRRRDTAALDVERNGELSYTHDGVRYVYRAWVIMAGVVVCIVVLLIVFVFAVITQGPLQYSGSDSNFQQQGSGSVTVSKVHRLPKLSGVEHEMALRATADE